ncbi:MAG: short-chain fatty acid transporter [Flavobacteriaceae bacterium]|nr:short-chain fatty acid transporter [Flavobacteriaceae bacterium]|tara:strand:+ start:935 stop:2332 length:1398 start_codon:yes stop_codon:yes gene_type:complete
MLSRIGDVFTDFFRKNMPDAFVFALILTLIVALSSFFFVGSSWLSIIESWYKGFWLLLEFGMQMVLLIVTGYTIALSPFIRDKINSLSRLIKTPTQVYFTVILLGLLVSMVSWGWIVIAAVLARELALRVKGINYPFLIACAYISNGSWVTGLSSSIPLLLNTENNYLIKSGIIESTISTSITLASPLNLSVIILYLIFIPLLMIFLKPKEENSFEIKNYLLDDQPVQEISIEKEANIQKLPFWALSDKLNNSFLLVLLVFIPATIYVFFHFLNKGFDLNLNIMIFIFLMLGLILHKSPLKYGIAMRRASSNVSSILFQFPFYAGIMGIMIYTGLGESLALKFVEISNIHTYPFFAFLIGGIVNFAIPSGGGEFAVIGPSIIEAVKVIGNDLPAEDIITMISRASLSVAYGESLTNLLQPFYLLLIIPIMGAGTKIQARDVMGFLVIPFILLFIIQSIFVTYMPI